MNPNGGTIFSTDVGCVVTGRHDPVGVDAGVRDLGVNTSSMTQNVVVSQRSNPFKPSNMRVAGGIVHSFLQIYRQRSVTSTILEIARESA